METIFLPGELTVYLVRNQEGEFFRAKGIRGYGESWVTDIKQARVYTKIGPARSAVTYFSGNHPKFGIPDIIKFDLLKGEVLQETSRVNKSIERKKTEEAERDKRDKLHKYEQAKKKLAEAEETIRNLKGKI